MLLHKGHGCEVDLWAFGCIIFEMLAGSTPFNKVDGKKAQTQAAMFERIMKVDYSFPDGFETMWPNAADLIRKLLVADPSQRISGAALRDHVWFKGVEWDRLLTKDATAPSSTPPHVPVVQGPMDVSNFPHEEEEEDSSEEESSSDDGSEEEEVEEGLNDYVPEDGEWYTTF